MGSREWICFALSIGVAAALPAGCGALRQAQDDIQPPIGAPGTIPHSRAIPSHAPSFRSFKVLYRFAGGANGADPMATLIDVEGSLYGTTKSGGYGDGTVYRVSTTGSESVVYSFAGSSDGAHPDGGLINVKGELYGTTYDGGAFGEGTVYGVSTNGIEKVLHSFGDGADGANPFTCLVNVKGILYGTTTGGGSYGDGSIYSISTSGSEKVCAQLRRRLRWSESLRWLNRRERNAVRDDLLRRDVRRGNRLQREFGWRGERALQLR